MSTDEAQADSPSPWALPREYSSAGGKWLTRAYQELARELHPVLGEVTRVQVHDLPEPKDEPPLSAPADQPALSGEPSEEPSSDSDRSSHLYRGIRLQSEWTTSTTEILNFDVEGLLTNINTMADEMGSQLVKAMTEHISEICESTGNVVNAEGRDLYETLIETAENMELTFDADGELQTKLLVSETLFNQIAVTPPTADQEARLKAVINRKREEWNAARHRRELP